MMSHQDDSSYSKHQQPWENKRSACATHENKKSERNGDDEGGGCSPCSPFLVGTRRTTRFCRKGFMPKPLSVLLLILLILQQQVVQVKAQQQRKVSPRRLQAKDDSLSTTTETTVATATATTTATATATTTTTVMLTTLLRQDDDREQVQQQQRQRRQQQNLPSQDDSDYVCNLCFDLVDDTGGDVQAQMVMANPDASYWNPFLEQDLTCRETLEDLPPGTLTGMQCMMLRTQHAVPTCGCTAVRETPFPSVLPSASPSLGRTVPPSPLPSILPTLSPFALPSLSPSFLQTMPPSPPPSLSPTITATSTTPTTSPTTLQQPTSFPSTSIVATDTPTSNPTTAPFFLLTMTPTASSTTTTSMQPTSISSTASFTTDTPTLNPTSEQEKQEGSILLDTSLAGARVNDNEDNRSMASGFVLWVGVGSVLVVAVILADCQYQSYRRRGAEQLQQQPNNANAHEDGEFVLESNKTEEAMT